MDNRGVTYRDHLGCRNNQHSKQLDKQTNNKGCKHNKEGGMVIRLQCMDNTPGKMYHHMAKHKVYKCNNLVTKVTNWCKNIISSKKKDNINLCNSSYGSINKYPIHLNQITWLSNKQISH